MHKSIRTRFLPALTAVVAITIALPVQFAGAESRTLIRFYKINSKDQERRVAMVRNADEAGCHNVKRNGKAHRVMVLGFQWCEVYAKKDCATNSLYVPQWAGKRKKDADKVTPNGRMGQGTRWILSADGNVPVRSFRCELKP